MFQSADVLLNVAWVSLSLTTMLAGCFFARPGARTRSIVAVLFVLVLVFPAISTADDITEQALMVDPAPSPCTVKSAKEIKQLIAPDTQVISAAQMPGQALEESVGERLASAACPTPSACLSSSSGIHSPPQL